MGASYPYVVLKFGFGPNISVVSAFFGFLALGLLSKSYNRWENNLVQTAGTAAGQVAFLCWLLAAFDILAAEPGSGFDVHLTRMQTFVWLSAAGLLGVFMAVPLRKHFIEQEDLPFPDGMAAGETLIMLDSRGEQGRKAAFAMIGALGGVGPDVPRHPAAMGGRRDSPGGQRLFHPRRARLRRLAPQHRLRDHHRPAHLDEHADRRPHRLGNCAAVARVARLHCGRRGAGWTSC